jgi:anthranilate synthase component 2
VLLIIDNYDSFTYNLIDYFNQLGQECHVIRNDEPKENWTLNIDGVVISPGPMIPQKAGHLMKMLDYYHDKKPIIGICLGHQAIGEYFGAKLIHAKKPMHGKVSKIKVEDDPLFKDIPKHFNVVRYHSLLLSNFISPLKELAITENGENMALKHESLPIWGIQYHPEAALTEFGLQVLKNWLHCAKL